MLIIPRPVLEKRKGGIKMDLVRAVCVRVRVRVRMPHIWPYISQDIGATLLKFKI